MYKILGTPVSYGRTGLSLDAQQEKWNSPGFLLCACSCQSEALGEQEQKLFKLWNKNMRSIKLHWSFRCIHPRSCCWKTLPENLVDLSSHVVGGRPGFCIRAESMLNIQKYPNWNNQLAIRHLASPWVHVCKAYSDFQRVLLRCFMRRMITPKLIVHTHPTKRLTATSRVGQQWHSPNARRLHK